jgi:CubicO group peptidase (beta-lactamase class C family)
MKLHLNRVITCFSLLLIVIFVTAACTLQAPRVYSSGQPQREYSYQIPEKVTDGWEVSSLKEEGIDTVRINELMSNILLGNFPKIHSVLLVKNGKLVLEEYFYDYNRERLHQIRSATKSIGSVLTGIAIDQGIIKNENERIYQHFKSYEPKEGWDERVREVTLKSLLTMTSGYDCDDHKGNFNCERNMYKSDDWLEYALNLPMAYNPGDHWAYNSASLWLVGEVISKESQMSIPDFADKYLYEPLAITNFQWGFSPNGRAWLAGNAEMKPRDMAKFGCVVLNKGKWKET